MTKKKRYKRYSPEFKREVLKRASEEGVTDVIVCEELGISARRVHRRDVHSRWNRVGQRLSNCSPVPARSA